MGFFFSLEPSFLFFLFFLFVYYFKPSPRVQISFLADFLLDDTFWNSKTFKRGANMMVTATWYFMRSRFLKLWKKSLATANGVFDSFLDACVWWKSQWNLGLNLNSDASIVKMVVTWYIINTQQLYHLKYNQHIDTQNNQIWGWSLWLNWQSPSSSVCHPIKCCTFPVYAKENCPVFCNLFECWGRKWMFVKSFIV